MTTIANTTNGRERWRTGPLYTISEAAHLANVHPTTVRRWLFGSQTPSVQMQPVFGHPDRSRQGIIVSFLQLAEIVIVSKFRRKRISLERIRRAHHYTRQVSHLDHPFAHLSLVTSGVNILAEFERQEPGVTFLVLNPVSGQLTLPGYVEEAIETFEFESDLAARWFPLGMSVPIVIDPRFSAGVPTIPHRRLTIQGIRKRWKIGQSMKFIAEDLDLDIGKVEQVLRYAESIAA